MRGVGCFLASVLGLGLQACVPQARPEAGSREPVRWILVERSYGDLEVFPRRDNGIVNPDAVVLAFQPLYSEDLTWQIVVEPEVEFVELVGVSPSGPVAPGEVVSATVRVGRAKAGHRYRLEARPSATNVEVIGVAQTQVLASESAVFRFTSCTSGRGGIAVSVHRVGPEQ